MNNFSIEDNIKFLEREFAFIDENWKSPVADNYKSYLENMQNMLNSTEKCLEKINEGYAKVEKILNQY